MPIPMTPAENISVRYFHELCELGWIPVAHKDRVFLEHAKVMGWTHPDTFKESAKTWALHEGWLRPEKRKRLEGKIETADEQRCDMQSQRDKARADADESRIREGDQAERAEAAEILAEVSEKDAEEMNETLQAALQAVDNEHIAHRDSANEFREIIKKREATSVAHQIRVGVLMQEADERGIMIGEVQAQASKYAKYAVALEHDIKANSDALTRLEKHVRGYVTPRQRKEIDRFIAKLREGVEAKAAESNEAKAGLLPEWIAGSLCVPYNVNLADDGSVDVEASNNLPKRGDLRRVTSLTVTPEGAAKINLADIKPGDVLAIETPEFEPVTDHPCDGVNSQSIILEPVEDGSLAAVIPDPDNVGPVGILVSNSEMFEPVVGTKIRIMYGHQEHWVFETHCGECDDCTPAGLCPIGKHVLRGAIGNHYDPLACAMFYCTKLFGDEECRVDGFTDWTREMFEPVGGQMAFCGGCESWQLMQKHDDSYTCPACSQVNQYPCAVDRDVEIEPEVLDEAARDEADAQDGSDVSG